MLDYLHGFYKELELHYKRAIHPRRFIISSEKKVIQFPISVGFQLFVLFLLFSGLVWSVYATGRFISTSYAFEAQSKTLRSVTAARTNNFLVSMLPRSATPQDAADNIMLMQNGAKMAMLQKQVDDLKTANETIVERIRTKTDGQLDDLESIVSQTGLNPNDIKMPKKIAKDDGEGGPFIPTEMPGISDEASDMFDSLDKLHAMRKVVANLPLGIPIENAQEHSSFGHRIDPFNGNVAFHSGLDMAGPIASQIHSTADGTVITAGRDGAYGNMVDIDHGYGIVTRYGHMSAIKVSKGDKVKKGDIIGIQGSTGRSTGPHLHYEVRYHGEAINPERFLQTGRLLELGSVSQN